MGLFGLGTSESDRQSTATLQRFIDEVGLYSDAQAYHFS
jgi:hypothetical protein